MEFVVLSVHLVIRAYVCLTCMAPIANSFITLSCHDTMLIEEDLSFKDAEARCKAYNYSGLAVLHNDEAVESFLNTIKDHANSSSDDYWIGLTSGNTPEGWVYRWSNGYPYPASSSSNSGCGKADSKGNDDIVNCNECRKSVCADYVDYGNVFSFVDDDNYTQSEADAKCKEKGFDRLAVVDSREKLDYAIYAKSWGSVYWVGMEVTAGNDFRWASGETVTWVVWHPDPEPDYLDTQKCIRMTVNGFSTQPCDLRMKAACENTTAPECPVHMPANVKPPRVRNFSPLIQVKDLFPNNRSDVISTQQTRSLMDCSLICTQTDGCKSSAYHEESNTCSSLSRRFTPDRWHKYLQIDYGWTIVDKCG